ARVASRCTTWCPYPSMAFEMASIVRGESYSASLSSAVVSLRFMLKAKPTLSDDRLPRALLVFVGSRPARRAADLSVVSTVAVYERPWHVLAAKTAPLGSNDGSAVLERNHTWPLGVTRRSILATSRRPSAVT